MEFRFERPPAEVLKSRTFSDELIERAKAEGGEAFDEGRARAFAELWAKGIAEGAAVLLLRLLARGDLTVSAQLRERVLSCTDLDQLGGWIEKAGIANSIEDVFPD